MQQSADGGAMRSRSLVRTWLAVVMPMSACGQKELYALLYSSNSVKDYS